MSFLVFLLSVGLCFLSEFYLHYEALPEFIDKQAENELRKTGKGLARMLQDGRGSGE